MMTGSLEARFQTRTVARMQEFSRIKEVVSQHNRHSSGDRPRESGNLTTEVAHGRVLEYPPG